jgi:hypothetical protein
MNSTENMAAEYAVYSPGLRHTIETGELKFAMLYVCKTKTTRAGTTSHLRA